MNSQWKARDLTRPLFFSLCVVLPLSAAHAISLQDVGPTGPGQTEALSVNFNGDIVGSQLSTAANSQVWVATLPNPAVFLKPLIANTQCDTTFLRVANNRTIVGVCPGLLGGKQGVIWNASNPAANPTRLMPLLLPEVGLRSNPTAINRNGEVAGVSIGALGTKAAGWPAGSGTAFAISNIFDGCMPVDLSEVYSSGKPVVALNCPNASGAMRGHAAVAGAGGYTHTLLPVPAGASRCVAVGVNNNFQYTGTCYFPGNVTKATFWNNATATPSTFALVPGVTSTTAFALNETAKVYVSYQDTSGNPAAAYWDPVGSFVTVIPPPPTYNNVYLADIAQDTIKVAFNSYAAGFYRCAIWSPSAGTQIIDNLLAGNACRLYAMSTNGQYVAGGATDNTGVRKGVIAITP